MIKFHIRIGSGRVPMKITKIVILFGQGADQLLFHTDLPDGSWPYVGQQVLTTTVSKGHGAKYANEHFYGIPVEMVAI